MKNEAATKETVKSPILIKTYEEACQKLGIPDGIPDVSTFSLKHQASLIANAKLIIISEALNEGWEPDWDNENEYKYSPWFYMDSPGFRFVGAGYDWTAANAASGSRLCFRTRKLAEYAGQTFLELFHEMMVLPKK